MKLKAALVFMGAIALEAVSAQGLVIDEKIPEFRVKEWVDGRSPSVAAHKMMLVEFFHSSNEGSISRLTELDRLATRYAPGLTVVVVSREDTPQVRKMLKEASNLYKIGIDDAGKTFAAFGVQYVPYAVLADPKGRLLWLGNPVMMNDGVIENNLEHGVYKDRSLRRASQGKAR